MDWTPHSLSFTGSYITPPPPTYLPTYLLLPACSSFRSAHLDHYITSSVLLDISSHPRPFSVKLAITLYKTAHTHTHKHVFFHLRTKIQSHSQCSTVVPDGCLDDAVDAFDAFDDNESAIAELASTP